MIYIGLPFPVIPASHLNKVAESLGQPVEEIRRVWGYCKYVYLQEDGRVSYLTEAEWHEQVDTRTHPYLEHMGSRGILKLGQKLLKEDKLLSLNCIYVPAWIWNLCKIKERKDILYLLTRVEERVNRYCRLVDMGAGAPEIIVRNEARMIEESVSAVINNSDSSGLEPINYSGSTRTCTCFSDIGYLPMEGIWINPDPKLEQKTEDDNEGLSGVEEVEVPKYYTEYQVFSMTRELDSLKLSEVQSREKIQNLEEMISKLNHDLSVEKEKFRNLQEERDRTVSKLSKENLALDHRIDEIIRAQTKKLGNNTIELNSAI